MKRNQTKIGQFFFVFIALLATSCGKQSTKIIFKPVSQIPSELLEAQVEIKRPQSKKTSRRLKEFQIPVPEFVVLKNGKVLPQLPHAQILSQFNRPRVPILKYSFRVKPGQLAEVSLVAPEMERSESPLPLTHTPQPFVWGKRSFSWQESKPPAFFPGKLLETHQEGEKVSVTVYPLQVETSSGKALRLVKGYWKVTLKPMPEPKSSSGNDKAVALILTSEKLVPGAKELQKFHQSNLSIQSEIITVEAISRSEKPVDLIELPEGYKSPEAFEKVVKKYDEAKKEGYDFETARKVIQYMRNRAEQSEKFKYVVILGNSQEVPPSYYFQENLGSVVTTGVTDQCYAAGKDCLEPRLAVGRLPFASLKEINQYLKKAAVWLRKSNDGVNELSLYGGRAFPNSPLYIGELGTLQTLNPANADWRGVQKFFETEGNFKRATLEDNFSGNEKSNLVYYLDHGMGNRLFAGEDYISSNDILKMDLLPRSVETEKAPPIVVSVACINAAFDEELLIDNTLEEKEEYGNISIGTALLKSQRGAIAYLGGSRDGLGSPETEIDEKGNVKVLGTSHGLQLLDGFIEKQRTLGGARLGDALVAALDSYAHQQGNDMKEFSHQYTYWITELLGDPLLPLPKRRGGEMALPPAQSEFKGFESETGYPQLLLSSVSKEDDRFSVSSTSPFTAKVYEMELGPEGYTGHKVVKTVPITELGTSILPIEFGKDLVESKHYLIKLVNHQGVPREQHVVFFSRP